MIFLIIPVFSTAQSNQTFNDCQLQFNTQQLSGEIKLSELKNAKSLKLNPNLNLIIRNFELTIQKTKESSLITFKCTGDTLNPEVQEYLLNLKTARRVLIEHINAVDSSGERHVLKACQFIVRD